VDDLLDATRIARNQVELKRERLDLNELVRRAVEDYRSIFERGEVRLETQLSSRPVFVVGDGARLAQVLGNLLHNAAKFTPPGGSAAVSVELRPHEERAAIRVADTGAGMQPEMLARLFEPFAQADRSLDRRGGGLGLGLSLAKGLVEMHGGEVRAHSAGPGKGAEFTVLLPLEHAPATTPASRSVHGSRRGRRILIIEDNLDAANSLREALAFGGHDVEIAHDGRDGIAKAHRFRPEVVLCDIGLPGMDGYEIARTLRADTAFEDTLLVALSGYALPEDLQRAEAAGFDRHVAKPPNLEKLEEILGSLPR
jgi:CheY-like chemotaxis protein